MNSKDHYVIAVDGLAGSGKTTLSRLLAKELGYTHFYTGLLYRGVAYLALRLNIPLQDEAALLTALKQHQLSATVSPTGEPCLLLDNENVTDRLHHPEVSEAASRVASLAGVREMLVPVQRQAFPNLSLVAEGRDMGTIIFPQADLKFYIHVEQEVRVRRRLEQLYNRPYDELMSAKGESAEELKRKMEIEIIERDRRDEERLAAPAKPAKDAIIIDNSYANIEQVLDAMLAEVKKHGLPVKGSPHFAKS